MISHRSALTDGDSDDMPYLGANRDYDSGSYQGVNRRTMTMLHIKALLDGDYDDRS